MKQRPLGVKLLGILAILWFGVVCLFGGVMALVVYQSGTGAWSRDSYLQLGVVLLTVGLVGVPVGIGILQLWNWARWLILIQALVFIGWVVYASIAGIVVDLFDLGEEVDWRAMVGLPIPLGWHGLILWYFLRPGVKAQFQRSG